MRQTALQTERLLEAGDYVTPTVGLDGGGLLYLGFHEMSEYRRLSDAGRTSDEEERTSVNTVLEEEEEEASEKEKASIEEKEVEEISESDPSDTSENVKKAVESSKGDEEEGNQRGASQFWLQWPQSKASMAR